MNSEHNYNSNSNKVALVLEGGAMRGLYTAGVIDVFMQNGIRIDTIFAVSAGALFGVNYKSKQMGRALRYNLKYARDKRYMGLYSLFTTGDIMNREFCFNKLVYLRASGSMPFVSNLVEINGNKYLDGAVRDPIPLNKVLELGYKKIIVVQTRPADYSKSKPWLPFGFVYRKYPNFVKTANKIYIKYNETLDLIKKYENEDKIIVLRPSKKIKMRRVEKNLNKLQAIYDVGVKDCNDKLEKIKEYIANDIKC